MTVDFLRDVISQAGRLYCAVGGCGRFRVKGDMCRMHDRFAKLALQKGREIPQLRKSSGPGVSIYFVQAGPGGPVKIGRSKNPGERLKGLRTQRREPLQLLASFNGAAWMEGALHGALSESRIEGEWFRLSPEVELTIALVRERNFRAIHSLIGDPALG